MVIIVINIVMIIIIMIIIMMMIIILLIITILAHADDGRRALRRPVREAPDPAPACLPSYFNII